MAETTVKVVVRCRPLLAHETAKNARDVATVNEEQGAIRIVGKTHEYGPKSVVRGPDRHTSMRVPAPTRVRAGTGRPGRRAFFRVGTR